MDRIQLTSADTLQLLFKTTEEEHKFLEAHQHRVAFYSSLASAVVGATVAGAMQAKTPAQHLLLLAGPVLILGVCHVGREGTFRFYQRFLESVTVRAKLEQLLGLTEPLQAGDSHQGSIRYWREEAIVAPRHLKSRSKSETSASFIASNQRAGYQRPTDQLFTLFQAVAVLLGAAILGLAAFA